MSVDEREQLLSDLNTADCMYLYDTVQHGDLDDGTIAELRSILRAVQFRDAAIALLQQHSELLNRLDD